MFKSMPAVIAKIFALGHSGAILAPEQHMKVERLIVGAAILLSMACVRYFSGGQVGLSYFRSGEKTVVSSATHPVPLVWAAAGICFFWILMRKEFREEPTACASLARRFLAFLVDLYLVVLVSGSVLVLIPLSVEARRTGHFEWSFDREYVVPTDAYVLLPLSLIGVLVLFFIMRIP